MRSAALLALLALASPAAALPSGARQEPDALEDLLRLARERRDAELARLAPEVNALLQRLVDLPTTAPPAARADLRAALAGLGDASAPLLVSELDPGADADAARARRAEEAALALGAHATPAITAALIEIASTASPAGQRNAVRVLGSSQERGRATTALTDLYASSHGELRREALRSLAVLGAPESRPVLARALASADDAEVATALRALTETRAVDAVDAVVALARRSGRAAFHVSAILDYFRACPTAASEDAVLALLDMVAGLRLLPSSSEQLLELLPAFEATSRPEVRKRLKELSESSFDAVREGALIALARLGDRGARRDALAPYEDAVDTHDDRYAAWRARGQIHLRLREPDRASRDFKKALSLRITDAEARDELWVLLARAYSLDDKPRQAAEALEAAWLSPTELAALRSDPDFAALAAHPKYGSALGGS